MKKFNVADHMLVKEYGSIHSGQIFSVSCTPDSKYIFTSDSKGFVKKIDVEDNYETGVTDYGKVHKAGIFSIASSRDSRYLFTSDISGNLKQFKIEDNNLHHDFEDFHKTGILNIAISNDSCWLITGDDQGMLKQVCISWKNNHTKNTKNVIRSSRISQASNPGLYNSLRNVSINHGSLSRDRRSTVLSSLANNFAVGENMGIGLGVNFGLNIDGGSGN